MKEIILSIIKLGNNSPFTKQFIDICKKMAMAQLSIYKNINFRNELMNKLGCSLKDLAYDCIADLFECQNGKYIHIDNYFDKISTRIPLMHDDEIKAYLVDLIISKTMQNIALLKENLGDIFWKVRKAVRIYLQRNNNIYNSISYKNEIYVYTNHEVCIDINSNFIPKEIIIEELFQKNYRTHQTSEIIDSIFDILNKQCEYCKAIKLKDLFTITKEFYEKRMSDHI